MKFRTVKKTVSSQEIDAGGCRISAEACLSALSLGEGFVLSISPVSVFVDTGLGVYRFDLKEEKILPEESIQISAPQSG